MSRIGDAIRAQRRGPPKWGTAARLAEQAGISPQYLNDIELGRRLPPVDTLLTIANVFPGVESAAWCWLLLTDLWGPAVSDVMRQAARADNGCR